MDVLSPICQTYVDGAHQEREIERRGKREREREREIEREKKRVEGRERKKEEIPHSRMEGRECP